MDTEIINRLYGKRATLIELSNLKISGTRINKMVRVTVKQRLKKP